jgi:DNA polymerase
MLVKSRTNITTGYGNRARGLYFVGEAPGRYGCDKTGIPFKGDRSGDYFMKALKKIGVSYKNAYFTNTIKCCPPENRTPTIEEISACNEMLMNEIKTAKLIVCVGGIAYTAITKRRAFVLRDTLKLFDNKIVIPHPSFILRLRKQKWYEQEILPALKTNISEKTTVFSKK